MKEDRKDNSDFYNSIHKSLFGAGIGIFISNLLKYWIQFFGSDGIQLKKLDLIIILIQIYVLFNFFRFLFGLRNFTEMTGQNFMPNDNASTNKDKSLIKVLVSNITKTFVTNVGIFQMFIFAAISMLFFPKMNINESNLDLYKYFYLDPIFLIKSFFILNFLILISDLLAVVLFNHLDPEMIKFRKANKINNENSKLKSKKRQIFIWIFTATVELAICCTAIFLLFMVSSSDLTIRTVLVLMSIKLGLMFVELMGLYYIKFYKKFKSN